MPATTCPKCQGSMELGVIPDMGHSNHMYRTTWLEGEPESSFWRGMKTKDKRRYALKTYRCTRCGYVESYATEIATGV
ncbi:MAG: PF20097 family protein [Xanthobacteraceae bacterium]